MSCSRSGCCSRLSRRRASFTDEGEPLGAAWWDLRPQSRLPGSASCLVDLAALGGLHAEATSEASWLLGRVWGSDGRQIRMESVPWSGSSERRQQLPRQASTGLPATWDSGAYLDPYLGRGQRTRQQQAALVGRHSMPMAGCLGLHWRWQAPSGQAH